MKVATTEVSAVSSDENLKVRWWLCHFCQTTFAMVLYNRRRHDAVPGGCPNCKMVFNEWKELKMLVNYERFGIEQDPNISVTLTEDAEFFCFKLEFKNEAIIRLHARSLVDLIHKANIALLDWQAQAATRAIEQLGKK